MTSVDTAKGSFDDQVDLVDETKRRSKVFPLTYFKDARSFLMGSDGQALRAHSASNVEMPTDAVLSDLDAPLDVSTVGYLMGEQDGYNFLRCRQITAARKKQYRGVIPEHILHGRFPVVELAFGMVSPTIRSETFRRFGQFVPTSGVREGGYHHDGATCGLNIRFHLRNADMPGGEAGPVETFESHLAACIGMAFVDSWHWQVRMGYVGGGSLCFWTDPEGAASTFAMRDVPEGRKRRAAIRHWVKSHWRQNRGGGLSEVRKHLRGATEFTWNGLNVRITPSKSDLQSLGGTP